MNTLLTKLSADPTTASSRAKKMRRLEMLIQPIKANHSEP